MALPRSARGELLVLRLQVVRATGGAERGVVVGYLDAQRVRVRWGPQDVTEEWGRSLVRFHPGANPG